MPSSMSTTLLSHSSAFNISSQKESAHPTPGEKSILGGPVIDRRPKRRIRPLPHRRAINGNTISLNHSNAKTAADAPTAQVSDPARHDALSLHCVEEAATLTRGDDGCNEEESKSKRQQAAGTDVDVQTQAQVAEDAEPKTIIVGGDDAISRTIIITLASRIRPKSILQWNFTPSSSTFSSATTSFSAPAPASTLQFPSPAHPFPLAFSFPDPTPTSTSPLSSIAKLALLNRAHNLRIAQWAAHGKLAKQAAEESLERAYVERRLVKALVGGAGGGEGKGGEGERGEGGEGSPYWSRSKWPLEMDLDAELVDGDGVGR